jgi:hypothetical protein
MRKFIDRLRDWISQSLDTQTSEYLKKLTHDPIFTIVIYLGNDINGHTLYTEQQDKKARIKIVVYVLTLMILRAKTKTCTMVKYNRSGSFTFMVSRFHISIAAGLMQSRCCIGKVRVH